MRLLVSVRSADEVPTALAGGADIIDAKDPARGSLGAVAPGVLSAIDVATPRLVPLSVALGDWTGPREVRAAMDAARTGERSAPVYLKLGFAGVPSLERLAPSLAGRGSGSSRRSGPGGRPTTPRGGGIRGRRRGRCAAGGGSAARGDR